MTSFYLAEYDVYYTADHHQSIEDIPGVPDIALNMAARTTGRTRGKDRRGAGCGGRIRGREVMVRRNGGW